MKLIKLILLGLSLIVFPLKPMEYGGKYIIKREFKAVEVEPNLYIGTFVSDTSMIVGSWSRHYRGISIKDTIRKGSTLHGWLFASNDSSIESDSGLFKMEVRGRGEIDISRIDYCSSRDDMYLIAQHYDFIYGQFNLKTLYSRCLEFEVANEGYYNR